MKKLCYGMCGYTKRMVKFAAGKRGRGWLEKVLICKGFLPTPTLFPAGDGQILQSFKQNKP